MISTREIPPVEAAVGVDAATGTGHLPDGLCLPVAVVHRGTGHPGPRTRHQVSAQSQPNMFGEVEGCVSHHLLNLPLLLLTAYAEQVPVEVPAIEQGIRPAQLLLHHDYAPAHHQVGIYQFSVHLQLTYCQYTLRVIEIHIDKPAYHPTTVEGAGTSSRDGCDNSTARVVVAVVLGGIPNEDLGIIDPLGSYIPVGDANR